MMKSKDPRTKGYTFARNAPLGRGGEKNMWGAHKKGLSGLESPDGRVAWGILTTIRPAPELREKEVQLDGRRSRLKRENNCHALTKISESDRKGRGKGETRLGKGTQGLRGARRTEKKRGGSADKK